MTGLLCPNIAGNLTKLNEDIFDSYASVSFFSGYTDRKGKLSFLDLSLDPYIDYQYSVFKYNSNTNFSQSGVVRLNKYFDNKLEIDFGSTNIEKKDIASKVDKEINLSPNPFNPINFNIPERQEVTLKVFNVKGEKIAELIRNKSMQGVKSINFNAQNYASGIYVFKLSAGKYSSVKTGILVK